MTTLLVLGFPYPTTAVAAAEEVALWEPDLGAEADGVAVVSRDDQGGVHITTNHILGRPGRPFFWEHLLTALILVPSAGEPGDVDLDPLLSLEALGLDASFQQGVREMLAADTSALFLLATAPVPADALTALGRFGGKLLATSLVIDPRDAIRHRQPGRRTGRAVCRSPPGMTYVGHAARTSELAGRKGPSERGCDGRGAGSPRGSHCSRWSACSRPGPAAHARAPRA